MTSQLEQRSDSGLLERILAYEEQAVEVLTRQIQTDPALQAIPGLTFQAELRQTKSGRYGPSSPIRLAEQKKVPRYYLSSFALMILFDGKPLAEVCPDGTTSLFCAFVPLVSTNRDEVLWYHYRTDFPQELAALTRRIDCAFPDGIV